MAELSESNIKFGVDVYKTVAEEKKGENIFISPFSIQTVMAMLHVGARNNSKQEIEKVLHFNSDDIHASFGNYLDLLNQKKSNYALSSANKVFIHNKFTFLDEYLQAVKKSYKSDAEKCDFGGDPESERQKINKWVEDETNSKIKDLISPNILNDLTAMILVNAIYFKGNWEYQFDFQDTIDDKFHVDSSHQIQTKMMKINKDLNIGISHKLECKILELPYVNRELSMFFILPDTVDGISKLERKLSSETLIEVIKEMHEEDVKVTIPRFKMDCDADLKSVLMKLGIKDTFIGGKADLSGIDGTKELYVSDAFHKAFVEVNEKGTEAAATTAFSIVSFSLRLGSPLEFRADHPFIFFIRDNRTEMILFWGRLIKPSVN